MGKCSVDKYIGARASKGGSIQTKRLEKKIQQTQQILSDKFVPKREMERKLNYISDRVDTLNTAVKRERSKGIIKKVAPSKIFRILRALFLFDCIMGVLYLIILYDEKNWDNTQKYRDDTLVDKIVNRLYYSLMISSTIGPPSGFVPITRAGKLLTIMHIYLSIMFLPFLLVAIIGLQLPFNWLDLN